MQGHQEHMNHMPMHPHPHHHQVPPHQQHPQMHHAQPVHHNNIPPHMGGGGGGGGADKHRNSVQNRLNCRNHGGGAPLNHVNNANFNNHPGGDMYGQHQQTPSNLQGSAQPPNEVAQTFVVFFYHNHFQFNLSFY